MSNEHMNCREWFLQQNWEQVNQNDMLLTGGGGGGDNRDPALIPPHPLTCPAIKHRSQSKQYKQNWQFF